MVVAIHCLHATSQMSGQPPSSVCAVVKTYVVGGVIRIFETVSIQLFHDTIEIHDPGAVGSCCRLSN
jgi:hypothetical protein